jgi:hypothetical protein
MIGNYRLGVAICMIRVVGMNTDTRAELFDSINARSRNRAIAKKEATELLKLRRKEDLIDGREVSLLAEL